MEGLDIYDWSRLVFITLMISLIVIHYFIDSKETKQHC